VVLGLVLVKQLVHALAQLARQVPGIGGGAEGVARLVPLRLGRVTRGACLARPRQDRFELGRLVRNIHGREVIGPTARAAV
jgi:hypothetical protein